MPLSSCTFTITKRGDGKYLNWLEMTKKSFYLIVHSAPSLLGPSNSCHLLHYFNISELSKRNKTIDKSITVKFICYTMGVNNTEPKTKAKCVYILLLIIKKKSIKS